MILAFSLTDIIAVPFGYLLDLLYQVTNNYGAALILFAIAVQMILLPATAKAKRSTMKMSRMQPRVQEIQRKFANDQQKQSEMLNKLYKDEGVSMGGGCLWSMLPLFILFPLYAVVRQPIVYMLHENLEVANQIVELIKSAEPTLFTGNNYYDQIVAARYIPQYAEAIKAAIPAIGQRTLEGINFGFLGINLGAIPQYNIFSPTWAWDWAHIGAILMALLSAGNQVITMKVSQKMNNSVITNEKGIEDKETAENSQSAQSMKMMMYTMPLMMLWIGFTVPAALSLYWFVGGVVRTVQDTILTKRYRKIYDEEDAVRLKRALEEERLEAEKERIRAEKRAANPEGITENTSKKKLQKQQRDMEAASKAAAAKEYAAKRGIVEEESPASDCMSGIPNRPYCKGRNYDPNRYASHSTEE